MNEYKPEGTLGNVIYTKASLDRAMLSGRILEAKVKLCDADHNLYAELGCMKGFIPREEAALGVREGEVRDIAVLSRVNKVCCFTVTGFRQINGEQYALLSRVDAQKKALEYMLGHYRCGDIADARITHLDRFGAFADIGCGIVGLIGIENISVSRISHPRDRFTVGQNIRIVIKDIDKEKKRFFLSHKELLGTWEENAAMFSPGQTVCGCVRSIESYGVFVELTPNLSGLAEADDGALLPELKNGVCVSVYIKNIIPEKMKIKLSLVDVFPERCEPPEQYKYYFTGDHIDSFLYSVPGAQRRTETVFSDADTV